MALSIGGLPLSAAAHPPPFAQVTLDFENDRYELVVLTDVQALLLHAEPGHVTDEQRSQLAAASNDERRTMIDAAKQSFRKRLVVEVNGQAKPPRSVQFPTAEDLAVDPEGHQPIRVFGELDKEDGTIRFKFPDAIGPVKLNVRPWNGPPQLQTLKIGEASWPVVVRTTSHVTGQAEVSASVGESPSGPGWMPVYIAYAIAGMAVVAAAVIGLKK